MYIEQ